MLHLSIRSTLLAFAFMLGTLCSSVSADEPAIVVDPKAGSVQWGGCPAFIGEGCQIAVLHGDPAKENLDILFKVPGDFKIPHHWHTSAERMVLISGNMEVTYDNQETELIKTGMYAYGPAKRPHTAYCQKGDECILFIAFEEPLDAHEVLQQD